MKRMRFTILMVLPIALVASACSSSDDSTPETVIVEVTVPGETVTETVIVEVPVSVPPAEDAVTIKFWSTETQPARLEKTQAIIDGFTAATGINVQLTATDEDALPQLMLTNAASGTLPDVVFHPLDFTIGWAIGTSGA